MSGNGVAMPRLRVSLADTIPERLPITIERADGEVELYGYALTREGPQRCPLAIRAEAESARKVWVAASGAGTEDYEFDAIAWERYLRDLMMALVPDMQLNDAELLAANGDVTEKILRYLHWWVDPAEATADPEAPGEETSPIGQTSSPTSPSPIGSRTPTS